MSEKPRIVAIIGGESASVDHLLVPKGLNLAKAYEKYNEYDNNWREQEFLPAQKKGQRAVYLTFTAWLIEFHKCKETDEIEEFLEEDALIGCL